MAGAGLKKYSYEHCPAGSGYTSLFVAKDSAVGEISVAVGTKGWTIAAGEGTNQVYAKLKDAAGNITTISDSIILDTQAPSGSLNINSNAVYSTSTGVLLTLDSADAATVCFSNDNQTYGDWQSC